MVKSHISSNTNNNVCKISFDWIQCYRQSNSKIKVPFNSKLRIYFNIC